MKKTLTSILFAALATASSAQNLEDIASLEVLPGWRAENGTHVAGLRITLAPGWKTYWRSPGDGGIPPHITFEGSENLGGAEFRWPVPEVFHQSGLRSIGYSDGVVVPLAVAPTAKDEPVALSGTLTIGVCEEICVPVQFELSADLPSEGQRDSAIIAALVDRPETADEAGVTSATCRLAPYDGMLQLTTTVAVPGLTGSEEIVVETGDPSVWVSEPDISVSNGNIVAVSDVVPTSGAAFALDRSAVRITVLGDSRAIDVIGCTGG